MTFKEWETKFNKAHRLIEEVNSAASRILDMKVKAGMTFYILQDGIAYTVKLLRYNHADMDTEFYRAVIVDSSVKEYIGRPFTGFESENDDEGEDLVPVNSFLFNLYNYWIVDRHCTVKRIK